MKNKIKNKTRKSIAKRFKIIANKKLKFRSSGKSHKLINKSAKRINQLGKKKCLNGKVKNKILKFIK